jgi:cytochrome c oxidase assembly factor CtaG
MELPQFWQITPTAAAALVVGTAHEVGRQRLARRQTDAHRRARWHRSLAFYAGLVLLALVASGPLNRWSMAWLSIHMVMHVLEMFYLPPLLILGAPWVPLLFAAPTDRRRRWLRWYHLSRSGALLRGPVAVLTNPVVAVVLFNGTMILWHIPAVYDWASWRQWPMDWVMAPMFVVTGYLFWRVILPSHPTGPRGSTKVQVAAVVVTAFEMLVLAMAMAIFTKTPWYSMHIAMDGPVAALRDQRWAAGILWICGDFWAVPALVLIAYRLYGAEGGVSASFERALGRV